MHNDFEKIYEQYIDKIYKFIFYKTWNQQDTNDIVSDTFLKIYQNLNKYDPKKSSLNTWIYKVAYNTCIDRFKTKKEYIPYEWVQEKWYEEDLLQKIQDKNKLEAILNFLNDINPKHKQIIIMKIWDWLSYKEISEITEISPNAAKQIFYRTVQQLGERFAIILAISIIYWI